MGVHLLETGVFKFEFLNFDISEIVAISSLKLIEFASSKYVVELVSVSDNLRCI